MPLPILNVLSTPGARDLLRLFHQTERDWTRHLGEETLLDVGTAFHSATLDRVWHANGLFDAALPDGMSAADAIAQVDAHFDGLGLRCWHWITNPSAPAEKTQPLVDALLKRGATVHRNDVLYLEGAAAARSAPAPEMPGIKIIPARASYRHARVLAAEMSKKWNEPQLVEASILHVEDPHFDALLAMKDGVPVATAGVLAMGEIGRIENVFVSEPFRRIGLGRTMILRMMEICSRALFKHVLLSTDPNNFAAKSLYESFGFRTIGEQTVYLLT